MSRWTKDWGPENSTKPLPWQLGVFDAGGGGSSRAKGWAAAGRRPSKPSVPQVPTVREGSQHSPNIFADTLDDMDDKDSTSISPTDDAIAGR